jgi:hypothetical protein
MPELAITAQDLGNIVNKVFFELEYAGRAWLGRIEVPPITISPDKVEQYLREGITIGNQQKGMKISSISISDEEQGKRYTFRQKTAEVSARIYWADGNASRDHHYNLRKTGGQWEIYETGGK